MLHYARGKQQQHVSMTTVLRLVADGTRALWTTQALTAFLDADQQVGLLS